MGGAEIDTTHGSMQSTKQAVGRMRGDAQKLGEGIQEAKKTIEDPLNIKNETVQEMRVREVSANIQWALEKLGIIKNNTYGIK